jgi:hypothetical protein
MNFCDKRGENGLVRVANFGPAYGWLRRLFTVEERSKFAVMSVPVLRDAPRSKTNL